MRLAKVSLRPGAGNLVNGILRKLVLLKVYHFLPIVVNGITLAGFYELVIFFFFWVLGK